MNNILPAITLYQPWATWIMRKWKTIETRTHNKFASLEGKTVLIHAGMKTDVLAVNNSYLTLEQIRENPSEMVGGFILGSAFVIEHNVCGTSNSQAALIDCDNTLRFGLWLTDIKKFEEPIPCKGEMGIWYYDMDLKQKVKKQ